MPAGLPEIHQKAFYFLFHIIQCSEKPIFPLWDERTSFQSQCIQHIANSLLPIVITITAAPDGTNHIRLKAALWPAAGDTSPPAALKQMHNIS